jgi:hypothetical protein
MAKSTTRERDHLENKCKKYKELERAKLEKSQTNIGKHMVSQIDPARKARIDQMLRLLQLSKTLLRSLFLQSLGTSLHRLRSCQRSL